MSLLPSSSYASLLKLCTRSENQELPKKLHCVLIKTLLLSQTAVANNLVSAYARTGSLAYARKVFDGIPHPNTYSWNALLSAYSKSRCISEMEDVFKRMPVRDIVSWNCFISGYVAHGSMEKRAVEAFASMLKERRVYPNSITLSMMLVLSSSKSYLGLGRQVHSRVIKLGFDPYVFVGSPLLDMYSKAGSIRDAGLVFDGMKKKNVVVFNTMITGFMRCGMVEDSKRLFTSMQGRDYISWTAMLAGLVQNGRAEEAVEFFREMRLEGVGIDQYAFGSVLTACGSLSSLQQGRQIHTYAIRTHFTDNVFVGSALVDMYSKCQSMRYAEAVFRRMEYKNIVSWTALIVGYGQNELFEEAVRVFYEMQNSGLQADDFTLASVISSCANLAILEEGKQFHCQALVSGLIPFITVSNALVSLYGKCGNIDDSQRLFNEMQLKDQVSWTALVSGYAQFGRVNETIDLFEKMLLHGLKPDGVMFIAVLSACSRAGLVEKGSKYYNSMVKDHAITPSMDHYTCMIDLYGRAGRLQEARSFIVGMPCHPDAIGWVTLLSSCKVYGNLEIGKWAAEALHELDPQNPASYVLLSSIYAAKGKWDDVALLRKGMRDMQVRKEPGCSWIKYKNKVHVFSADDQLRSPYMDQIYDKLEELNAKMVEAGYKPELSNVFHNVIEHEKIAMLNHHSERLAIAFGLIFIPHPLLIRVMKNLRVCSDCHNATKYISKIVGREILVRDAVRFHLFKDGTCSCGDFW